jgi:16S rRNA processing protein RimM
MTVAAVPLVAVGELLRPHGLHGEVRVRSLTDRTEDRFRRLRECILWDPDTDQREPCRIASCRFEGDTPLVRLEGIDSPEAARRLTGRLLAVDRSQALPAPEGSFYPWQLEGARVETRDGRVVGSFAGVETGGAQDLWVVVHEGREHLIPAVAEIVVDVNVAERRIVIDPPEGLLEL